MLWHGLIVKALPEHCALIHYSDKFAASKIRISVFYCFGKASFWRTFARFFLVRVRKRNEFRSRADFCGFFPIEMCCNKFEFSTEISFSFFTLMLYASHLFQRRNICGGKIDTVRSSFKFRRLLPLALLSTQSSPPPPLSRSLSVWMYTCVRWPSYKIICNQNRVKRTSQFTICIFIIIITWSRRTQAECQMVFDLRRTIRAILLPLASNCKNVEKYTRWRWWW